MRTLKLILASAFALAFLGQPSFAANSAQEYGTEFSFNHGSGFQKHQLGRKIIENTQRELKLTYSFAQNGGAIGTIIPYQAKTPGGIYDATASLPKNAIVTGCFIDVITAPTSLGSPTIAFSTGKTAADLKAATAIGSYTGIVACIPTGSAATAIKLTADVTPTMTIATAALTAGQINLHIFYELSD